MDKVSNIYMFTNKTNNKKYIGQAENPKERYKQHKKDSKYKDFVFYRAIRKYGFDNFDFKIIEANIPLKYINEKEKYYIKKYNTLLPNGYNMTIGGEGTHGYKHTDETKKLMSEKKKGMYIGENNPNYGKGLSGKDNPNYGVKMSEETKNKISKGNKGKIRTEETKKKISNSCKNVIHNEEWNKKVSESLRNMSEEKKAIMIEKRLKNNSRIKQIKGINLETNKEFIFKSARQAGKWIHDTYGFSKNSHVRILKSIEEDGVAYGFKWEYIEK